MRIRLIALSLLVALMAMFTVAPMGASGVAAAPGSTATLTDSAGNVLGTVTNLVATHDAAANTTAISGTFTDSAGNATNFTSNLIGAVGTCEILDLVLGPLDLNLLGLVVHLDQVHLNITAVPGAGNLLGNLLCGVANLLNGGPLAAILGQLTVLLNQIFALL
jgi:hypothetical protein